MNSTTETQFDDNKKLTKYFWGFSLVHLIVWTLAPALIYFNPPNDSLEGIAWGNLWLLGYEKHPLLAPWLTAGITNLFNTVGWPIYLLSQLFIILCFWAIWRLGKKILPVSYALVGVILLESINYYNLQSAIFDPNIAMLPFWALMSLSFYLAVTENKWRDWVLLGIFTGLAMLSKYESGLLVILLFVFLIVNKDLHRHFKSLKLYVAGLVAFIIFLPNFIWLCQHHFDAITYAVGEMQGYKNAVGEKHLLDYIKTPVKFLFENLGNLAPILILSLPFYSSNKNTSVHISRFDRKYIIYLAWAPLIATILMALIFQATLISRWSFPFFSLFGLFWLIMFKPTISKKRLNGLFIVTCIYWLLLILGMVFVFLIKPYVFHSAPHSASFPGKKIANYVTNTWHKKYNSPLPYIAGSHNVVVNVAAFSKDKPRSFFNLNLRQSPWINLDKMENKGGVFVLWQKVPAARFKQEIKNTEQRFPRLTDGHIVVFQRLVGKDTPPINLWIAYLPPT